jgi:diguanylate cyclase
VQYTHDKKLAKEYAAAALERIIREGLTATPNTFELWYAYFSGQSADITRAIDILIANNQQPTDDRCKELYHRFLSETRNEETVRRAGDQINTTLKTVSVMVKDVKTATTEFQGKLGDVSTRVRNVKDPAALSAIVNTMVQDTQSMIDRNHLLEAELDKSASVMQELQRDLEDVRREAMTDGLTGLSNRKSFDAALRRVADESKAAGGTFSLLMVDIDHFKNFNDNFGHQIGDQVLRLVARTLTDGVKGRDIAARYGGEEFAIILPDTPLDAGVHVGNALRKAVATKDVINRNTAEKLGRITMSVGVAEYKPGENVTDMIERADSALYTAKHNGRNQVAAAPTPGK